MNRLFNKAVMVGAALVALYLFYTPKAHAFDLLDVVRQAIYTKNLSTAIKNTDWSQQLEKATIKTIENKNFVFEIPESNFSKRTSFPNLP